MMVPEQTGVVWKDFRVTPKQDFSSPALVDGWLKTERNSHLGGDKTSNGLFFAVRMDNRRRSSLSGWNCALEFCRLQTP
jgi:hypothetical protein